MKKILVALLAALLLLCGAALAECAHEDTYAVEVNWPTCEAAGQADIFCTTCNEYLGSEALAAKGHEWGSFAPATVDAKKHYQVATCNTCGATKTYSEAHDFEIVGVAKEATCTTEGYYTVFCAVCDYWSTQTIKAEGHYWEGELYAEPTCTEQGYLRSRCPKCGESKTEYTKALGHKMSEWVQSVAPTCTVDGMQYRICVNCDLKETKVVKALGHKFDKDRVEVIKKDGKTYLQSNCLICYQTITKEYTGSVTTNNASKDVVANQNVAGGNTQNSTANSATTNAAGVTIPATGETTSIAPIMMVLAIAGLAVLAASKQKVNG